MITKEQIAEQYQQIQDEICAGLELADGGGKFQEEIWDRSGGGGGRYRDCCRLSGKNITRKRHHLRCNNPIANRVAPPLEVNAQLRRIGP